MNGQPNILEYVCLSTNLKGFIEQSRTEQTVVGVPTSVSMCTACAEFFYFVVCCHL